MTRALCVALTAVLLAASPALGKGIPAGLLLEKLLQKARKGKQRQLERLTQKRHFVREALKGAASDAYSIVAKVEGDILDIEVKRADMLNKHVAETHYVFDAESKLIRIEVTWRNKTRICVPADDHIRVGQTAEDAKRAMDWGPEFLGEELFYFVLPCLFEKIPGEVSARVVRPDHIWEAAISKPLVQAITMTRGSTSRAGKAKVQEFTLIAPGQTRQLGTLRVVASGAEAGRFLETGYGNGAYRAATDAEAAAFTSREVGSGKAPRGNRTVQKNEEQARAWLEKVHQAQTAFAGENDGAFAATFEELDLEVLGANTHDGYQFKLLRPEGAPGKYIALAKPFSPGRSGISYFVVNHEGSVFESESPLTVDEGCEIPATAKAP